MKYKGYCMVASLLLRSALGFAVQRPLYALSRYCFTQKQHTTVWKVAGIVAYLFGLIATTVGIIALERAAWRITDVICVALFGNVSTLFKLIFWVASWFFLIRLFPAISCYPCADWKGMREVHQKLKC